ncbi:MAG: hypothetical protein NT165_00060 [Candidatus Falkowbacteria bacterium]|nr:hypothetical protein [Candidatus Falkowbacteria bacterium]
MDKEPKVATFKAEDYHDKSEPSLKMIGFGLWLTENRRRLIKIVIALLIFTIIGFFVYSSYGVLYYLLVGKNQDQSLTENFTTMGIDLQQAHLRASVAPLVVSAPLTFHHSDKLDLAVQIKNQNEKYFSSIEYCFLADGKEFSCGSDFILPNTEKYILSLAQSEPASDYKFIIKKTSWQRIDNRKYPDWPGFYAKSNNFVISNLTFSSVNGESNLAFNMENKSPYNFWEVPLNITLASGGSLIGVNRFVLADFKSLEKRPVSISWQSGLSSGLQAMVTPDINVLDESIYRH